MFLLDSNDSLIIHAVSSILQQKEIVHTLDKRKKYFFKIEIIKNSRDIQLKGFSKIIKLDIPTSINSIIKKQIDISLGNIIGSNIANIVFAIGLSSIIKEIYFSYNSILIFNNFMILLTLLVFLLILFFKKISKIFSLLFISIYFVFIYLNFYKVN